MGTEIFIQNNTWVPQFLFEILTVYLKGEQSKRVRKPIISSAHNFFINVLITSHTKPTILLISTSIA